MAETRPSRPPALSSELGDSDFAINYNSRTGRPIRNARKADSPFVDSAVAISDEESSDDEAVQALASRSRKRQRSPSPPLSDIDSDLETLSADGESDHDAIEVRPRSGLVATATSGVQITLKDIVINVPPGHVGPIVLHLTPEMTAQPPVMPVKTAANGKVPKERKRPSKKQCHSTEKHAGFLDLPAELRNEIYRLVFVGEGRLKFANPTTFGRSAAFLRTCSQVHEEGRSILYAENDFYFARRMSRYGSFWEDEWKELGFRSVRKFLKIIGPMNTGLIRNVSLQLEDAIPCLNPDKMSHEDRRFVHDDTLMSILRHLGDHGNLQKLMLNFHGRRRVETTDERFLTNLKRVKADHVEFVKYPIGRGDSIYASESKQEESVRKMLLKTMVRREKLYD
ncbi:hypothetical protein LTR36_008656 [Oleoguttula mirabilis]|uniref:Uncharacterized protein n=1 Tax=Oleoguttula mirabilis TaxID=1507867 RepID=A0AAV9JTA5_9PEZI|nr:hypothetical protein LTR36_008656 [Oleoguttula mirabilis]